MMWLAPQYDVWPGVTRPSPPPYAIQQYLFAFLKKNSRCKKGKMDSSEEVFV